MWRGKSARANEFRSPEGLLCHLPDGRSQSWLMLLAACLLTLETRSEKIGRPKDSGLLLSFLQLEQPPAMLCPKRRLESGSNSSVPLPHSGIHDCGTRSYLRQLVRHREPEAANKSTGLAVSLIERFANRTPPFLSLGVVKRPFVLNQDRRTVFVGTTVSSTLASSF